MAKIVKIRIRRGGPGEKMMVYPPGFNADEAQKNGGDPIKYSEGIGLGEPEEWMYLVLPNALADSYALDPDMEIVPRPQAETELEAWRVALGEPMERVDDSDRIAAIQLRMDLARDRPELGIDVSAEDLKALDPNDEMPGITNHDVRMKRVFNKRLNRSA